MEKKLSLRLKYLEFVFLLFFFNLLSMLFAKFSIVISLQKNIKTHKNHISHYSYENNTFLTLSFFLFRLSVREAEGATSPFLNAALYCETLEQTKIPPLEPNTPGLFLWRSIYLSIYLVNIRIKAGQVLSRCT